MQMTEKGEKTSNGYYKMTSLLSTPILLEQLAEEASELAQAALKCARVLRKENPCRIDLPEAMLNLKEEYTDVVLCARVINLTVDERQLDTKYMRWLRSISDDNRKDNTPYNER